VRDKCCVRFAEPSSVQFPAARTVPHLICPKDKACWSVNLWSQRHLAREQTAAEIPLIRQNEIYRRSPTPFAKARKHGAYIVRHMQERTQLSCEDPCFGRAQGSALRLSLSKSGSILNRNHGREARARADRKEIVPRSSAVRRESFCPIAQIPSFSQRWESVEIRRPYLSGEDSLASNKAGAFLP